MHPPLQTSETAVSLRRASALLPLLVACRPLPDRWQATADLCAVDKLAPPDADCRDALFADFSVDSAAFDADDQARLAEALRSLLLDDAGDLDDLDAVARAPLRRHLARAARRLDTTELRVAAYDLAASQVSAVRPGSFAQSDWRAAYDPDTSEILVRTPLPDDDGGNALLLFHEAMHGIAPPHVPCPERPEDSCDRRSSGSYGLQADYAALLLVRCDPVEEPERCEWLSEAEARADARVLAD